MTREEALALVQDWVKNPNLVKHHLAAEAVMKTLAKHLGGDEEKWRLVGLLHDADYEQTKNKPERHALMLTEELERMGVDQGVIYAIKAHNKEHTKVEPKSKMDWALYCSDELTGFIVAIALVMPDKKLSSVKVESILKKMKEKSFAAGVNREQIKMCKEKLGIPLSEFVKIALGAMQGIADDLGL